MGTVKNSNAAQVRPYLLLVRGVFLTGVLLASPHGDRTKDTQGVSLSQVLKNTETNLKHRVF